MHAVLNTTVPVEPVVREYPGLVKHRVIEQYSKVPLKELIQSGWMESGRFPLTKLACCEIKHESLDAKVSFTCESAKSCDNICEHGST